MKLKQAAVLFVEDEPLLARKHGRVAGAEGWTKLLLALFQLRGVIVFVLIVPRVLGQALHGGGVTIRE